MLLLQLSLLLLLIIGLKSQALYIINDLVEKKDYCFVVAAVLLQDTMLDKENRPKWT